MERNDRIGMRVKPTDKKMWKAAAKKRGLSLSAWIEAELNWVADDVRVPVVTKAGRASCGCAILGRHDD